MVYPKVLVSFLALCGKCDLATLSHPHLNMLKLVAVLLKLNECAVSHGKLTQAYTHLSNP